MFKKKAEQGQAVALELIQAEDYEKLIKLVVVCVSMSVVLAPREQCELRDGGVEGGWRGVGHEERGL